MRNKSWYRIEAKEEVSEILIYNDVGQFGVSAEQFRSDLFALKAKEITLRINSRGGEVFNGVAIHNAIAEHPATVTARIDSLAASIASFIPMAADRIVMAKNARMMVHKAHTIGIGNADDFRKLADTLDDVDTILIDAYAARTGMARREIKDLLASETWLNPKKAKEMGFIDEIAGEEGARAQFDLSPFSNVPEDVKALFGKEEATERDIEQLLRDAGVSRKAAMAAVAAIKGEPQRDTEADEEAARELLAKIQLSNLTRKFKGV